MKNPSTHKSLASFNLALATVASFLLAPLASAQTIWTNQSGGTQLAATAGNWSNGAPSGSNLPVFSQNISLATTVNWQNTTYSYTLFNHTSTVGFTMQNFRQASNGLVVESGSANANHTDRLALSFANSASNVLATMRSNSSSNGLLEVTAISAVAGNTAARTVVLEGSNTGNNAVSGGISQGDGTMSITKAGTGSWSLGGVNTYTGITTISGGTLSVATIGNGGTAGNLGAATAAASNIVFDGGKLLYTGANSTSDRAFTINAGKTAIIENANNLSFAGATGSSTTGGLTKLGVGTLTLTGVNTYTGNTTVNAGTLLLAAAAELQFKIGSTGVNNGLLGTGNVTFDGIFKFDLTTAGTTVGNTWNIVDAALVDLYGGSFSVASTLGSFTNDNGLWSRTENGVLYQFNQSSGALVVAIPEPSTWALLAGGLSFVLALRRRR